MQKERRIGTLTFGIILVLTGVLVSISMFTNVIDIRTIMRFWPVVFIVLGLEILVTSLNKEIKIKYDVWGILLTMFIVFTTGIISCIDYAINDVLFSSEMKQFIGKELSQDTYSYYFKKENIEIVNNSNILKKVKIVEDKDLQQVKMHFEITAKDGKYLRKNNYLDLINVYEEDKKVVISSGYEENEIENLFLIIHTPDANLIKFSGNKVEK